MHAVVFYVVIFGEWHFIASDDEMGCTTGVSAPNPYRHTSRIGRREKNECVYSSVQRQGRRKYKRKGYNIEKTKLAHCTITISIWYEKSLKLETFEKKTFPDNIV